MTISVRPWTALTTTRTDGQELPVGIGPTSLRYKGRALAIELRKRARFTLWATLINEPRMSISDAGY